MCVTPMAFSSAPPLTDFRNAYAVATNIVGMDTKNEKSSADERDMPAICPAAIVDMDREVPGKTADRIWHSPIHRACPSVMSSIFQVRIDEWGATGPAFSDLDFAASTTHMIKPPTSSDEPMTARLSRFFPMTLVSR